MKLIFLAIATLISVLVSAACPGEDNPKDSVVAMFNRIDSSPSVLVYSNTMKVDNNGGHLQGVQLLEAGNTKFAVLTGSSASCSYYSVVKQGNVNQVLSVNKLMDKPYKHAGGFQIFRNLMAVGIEDNSAKDKSMVWILDLEDPEKPPGSPVSVIRREGAPMRSTAGCVGITSYGEKLLVAVCDWDSRNIDLYLSQDVPPRQDGFNKFHSINIETVSRVGWTDNNWSAYQNINLFTFNNKEVYLIGLGQNTRGEDVADLYSLAEDLSGNFKLIKMASKTFECSEEVSFRAGAGVFLGQDGKFRIIACGNHIEPNSCLNLFGKFHTPLRLKP